MPNSVLTIDCNDCRGQGYIYFGDSEEYDVMPCECVSNPTNEKE